jgi:DNA-binding response OmpR family regulator
MAMLLIIEDEAVLARNVARFFEKLGHTVEVAHDGPAGVEAARRVMPDVAIVDFQLPGLDGLEVIGALRKIDAELRCVMVTGHASVPVAIDAMKAGYMDLLTKPVALASLKAVVDRALAERGTRRALDYYQKKEADELQPGRAGRRIDPDAGAARPGAHHRRDRAGRPIRPARRSWCWARPAPARSWWRAPATTPVRAPRPRSWKSTAPRCRRT